MNILKFADRFYQEAKYAVILDLFDYRKLPSFGLLKTATHYDDRERERCHAIWCKKFTYEIEQGFAALNKNYSVLMKALPNGVAVHIETPDGGHAIAEKHSGNFTLITFLAPGMSYRSEGSIKELVADAKIFNQAKKDKKLEILRRWTP